MSKIEEGPNWKTLNLEDIRDLDSNTRREPRELIEAAENEDDAVEKLAINLGLRDALVDRRIINTVIGGIVIIRDKLVHIVEKRKEARERYVLYALDTLENPYEVWRCTDRGAIRYCFVGVYKTRNQMSVTIQILDNGNVLWNFMHTEAKRLNRHRRGDLIYSRKS